MRVMTKLAVLAALTGALGFTGMAASAVEARSAPGGGCTFNHMTGFVWCY